MLKYLGSATFIAAVFSLASFAYADTIAVPGTANPFYAGRNDTGGDGTVPPLSNLVLIPGATLTFKATGGAGFTGDCCYPPDGDGGSTSMDDLDSTTGIAGIDNGPAAALIGVFLNDKTPKPPAPARLDFSVIGTDFAKLKPHLKQMFFIGDGRKGMDAGKRQKFIVPKGATRLFLAISDGSGWFNNSGEIDATVTQTPPQ
jgi:hypothetical protein